MPTTRRIRAYSFTPGEPPSEIQLWRVGENPTDYGIHIWNERSVKEVVAEYEKRGNPLQIDIEHNQAEKPNPSNPGPTGGYARLEIRDGAPWLIFDWSEYAIEQIRTRQRLFLSPEYEVDSTSGEIIKLIRVSLVGDPGTHNARMLASSLRSRVRAGGKRMDLAVILSALKVVLTTEDAEEARKQIEALVAEIESLADNEEANASEETEEPVEAEADEEEVQAESATDEGEEEEDKPVVVAKAKKAKKTKASAPKKIPNVVSLLSEVAELRAELREQQVKTRIAANRDRIPESLIPFAETLDIDQLDEFISKLPEPKTTGIRASSKPTMGDKSTVVAGHVDPETAKALDKAFGTNVTRSESIIREGHRVIASHVYKRGQ